MHKYLLLLETVSWNSVTNFKNMFLFKATVNMFIIGDCLVSNLSRYINHGRLNLGIAGDNLQNFLWRKNNFNLLANSNLNYFFIHYGGNKSHHTTLVNLLLAISLLLGYCLK